MKRFNLFRPLSQLRFTPSRPTLKSGLAANSALLATGFTASGLFLYYVFDARSSIHEYVFCPLIRLLTSAEDGHKLGIWLMKYGLAPRLYNDVDDKILQTTVFGETLSNPIGVAAGLDKNGEAIEALFNTGFGYVEIGSITPKPQPGNPQPRFFRLPKDNAVINRYGFNSDGHDDVIVRLKKRLEKFYRNHQGGCFNNSLRENRILGINLGKNKTGDEVEDYLKGVENFNDYADFLVINVSSPNTPGLRNLQSGEKLTHLLTSVINKRDSLTQKDHKKTPVLVKIAPDLDEDEIKSIVEAAKKSKVNGIIVSNTTIQRPDTLKHVELKNEAGGLSGAPVKPFSLNALKTTAKYAKGTDLVLVGCGGISSGKDALEFGKAGASYVQLYTSFAYKGPGLVSKIKDELTAELKKEGKTWEQIVGSDI